MMNSQSEQFFKGILIFVVVIILGSFIAKQLQTNYSSFQIEETTETTKK